tara:strand:- start:924 stop:1250 length:327 start_codon:yes stop_codon:yes gene_type:complete
MGSGKRDDCNLGAEKIGEPTSSIARQQKIQFVQHVNSPTIVSPSCASLEYNRSLLAERIGVGRHDPFATYPIHITNKIQQVLDAGKWSQSRLVPPTRLVQELIYKSSF